MKLSELKADTYARVVSLGSDERFIRKIDLVFGESFGSATAAVLFHRQKVEVGSLIMSGPQYMNVGIFNKLISYIIPRIDYSFT